MGECKYCGITQVKTKCGRRPGSRSYIFRDEKGRQWNGKECPDCRVLRGKERDFPRVETPAVLKAPSSRPLLGPKDVLHPPKLRPCKTCGFKSANYYRCAGCSFTLAAKCPDTHVGCYSEDMFSLITVSNTGAGFRY